MPNKALLSEKPRSGIALLWDRVRAAYTACARLTYFFPRIQHLMTTSGMNVSDVVVMYWRMSAEFSYSIWRVSRLRPKMYISHSAWTLSNISFIFVIFFKCWHRRYTVGFVQALLQKVGGNRDLKGQDSLPATQFAYTSRSV